MKKIAQFIICSTAALFLFTGCSSYGSIQEDETRYSAQFAYSANDYQMYINREIEPITNILSSNMLLARNVVNGEYPVEDALNSAKEGLRVIQECKSAIDVMQPPDVYSENRLEVLRTVGNAEKTMEAYIAELEKSELDSNRILALADVMKSDFIALTGQFQVIWK